MEGRNDDHGVAQLAYGPGGEEIGDLGHRKGGAAERNCDISIDMLNAYIYDASILTIGPEK